MDILWSNCWCLDVEEPSSVLKAGGALRYEQAKSTRYLLWIYTSSMSNKWD